MSKYEKLFFKILAGKSDNDINFSDLIYFLRTLGWTMRIKGSHHIFTKENVPEIINIQPKGSKAKDYQVKQIRKMLSNYKLDANE